MRGGVLDGDYQQTPKRVRGGLRQKKRRGAMRAADAPAPDAFLKRGLDERGGEPGGFPIGAPRGIPADGPRRPARRVDAPRGDLGRRRSSRLRARREVARKCAAARAAIRGGLLQAHPRAPRRWSPRPRAAAGPAPGSEPRSSAQRNALVRASRQREKARFTVAPRCAFMSAANVATPAAARPGKPARTTERRSSPPETATAEWEVARRRRRAPPPPPPRRSRRGDGSGELNSPRIELACCLQKRREGSAVQRGTRFDARRPRTAAPLFVGTRASAGVAVSRSFSTSFSFSFRGASAGGSARFAPWGAPKSAWMVRMRFAARRGSRGEGRGAIRSSPAPREVSRQRGLSGGRRGVAVRELDVGSLLLLGDLLQHGRERRRLGGGPSARGVLVGRQGGVDDSLFRRFDAPWREVGAATVPRALRQRLDRRGRARLACQLRARRAGSRPRAGSVCPTRNFRGRGVVQSRRCRERVVVWHSCDDFKFCWSPRAKRGERWVSGRSRTARRGDALARPRFARGRTRASRVGARWRGLAFVLSRPHARRLVRDARARSRRSTFALRGCRSLARRRAR